MRFDDRLATALAQAADNAPARQALWRQLVDLLAQGGSGAGNDRAAAFERLRAWRAEVPTIVRQGAALQVAGRQLPSDLLRFFAEDTTPVSAPLLAVAAMSERDWESVIPALSPIARALLRHRRDLPAGAVRALDLFGRNDLIIEAAPPAQAQPTHSEAAPLQVESFAFETGAEGLITWSDLPMPGAIVGLSIGYPAPPGGWGVDGQAAGAFRRRAPFRDARLLVASGTAVGGCWSISGVPSFDAATGRFTGYRGAARRPGPGERAEPALGSTAASDSLRQLSHELRTPLNAIGGFAEMIEQQMLGPVPPAYRQRAAAILSDARRVETVLDDLDEAARPDEAEPATPKPIDCALLLARLVSELGPAAGQRGVLLALAIAPRCESVLVDPAIAERMIKRLLGTAVGLAGREERIDVMVSPGEDRLETSVTVTRPALLADYDDARMFEVSDVAGEDISAGPPLGLGFTLRMIRNLAEGCGGRFGFDPECFRLRLPTASAGHSVGGGSEPRALDARNLAE